MIILIVNCIAAFPLYFSEFNAGRYGELIGVFLASSLIMTYCAYLFYSGWTELKEIMARPILIWIGIIGGFILATLCLMAQTLPMEVAGLILIVLSVQDVFRMIVQFREQRSE